MYALVNIYNNNSITDFEIFDNNDEVYKNSPMYGNICKKLLTSFRDATINMNNSNRLSSLI